MSVEKVKGLVIKSKNINENDKYITILCEEYGKLSFKASGVRNYKSKNLASAQPFAYSEFTLFKTPNFVRMNEATIIENFYDLRLDVTSLALAAYLCDIAGIVCVGESEDDGQILRLLLNTLHIISNKKMPNKIIKAVFELRVLTKSGFMPNLNYCEICSREDFDPSGAIFFDVIGGNLICGDCIDKLKEVESAGKKLVRISTDVLNALRFITSVRDEKLFSFVLHDDIVGEFANVCEKYLLEQIGMNIDSLKYYKGYEK
ncbi:MAG: DNA repair protein RecO [Oscillospiraceae bacterium]|nr:DNA repair protein RecO [Oscillospiraceae bacterium]